MKIGVVVEGQSEFVSLPALLGEIEARTRHQILRPLRGAIPPLAPTGTIARACKPLIEQLVGRGVGKVVVLLDLENRDDCAGDLALELEDALRRLCGDCEILVVFKHRTYENWIVADLTALRQQRGRFVVSRRLASQVAPNRADSANAKELLGRAARGPAYHKIKDARNTMDLAEPSRIGKNSRSFRRFLRVVGFPQYRAQSRKPC